MDEKRTEDTGLKTRQSVGSCWQRSYNDALSGSLRTSGIQATQIDVQLQSININHTSRILQKTSLSSRLPRPRPLPSHPRQTKRPSTTNPGVHCIPGDVKANQQDWVARTSWTNPEFKGVFHRTYRHIISFSLPWSFKMLFQLNQHGTGKDRNTSGKSSWPTDPS